MESATGSLNRSLLVLDGETRAALSVVRSLGRAGYNVWSASCAARPLSAASRFNYRRVICPDPAADPARFASWLVSTVQTLRPAMVIPVSDVSLDITLDVEQAVRNATVLPVPTRETTRTAALKNRLLAHASLLGINCPQTLSFTYEELQRPEIADQVRRFRYPACIKPVASQSRKAGNFAHFRVQYPKTVGEVEAWSRISGVPMLLQQFIEGEGIGYFAVCVDGEPAAEFAHRRILEKPPSGGVSVLSESIALADSPVEESRRLLRSLNWNGVAMVEYKRRTDGTFWLMEVNPRFWGSLQLAIDSGRDFPRYLCQLFYPGNETPGERLARFKEDLQPYAVGQRLRWSLGTLDHLLINLKTRRAKTLKELLLRNSLHLLERPAHTRAETFRFDDMRPFLLELRSYCGF